jgi:hypothetical protein
MSVVCQTWVWQRSKTTGNDRLLLLAIADCADDDGDNAWPSVETLADKATCSERTVQRRIQHLEEIGCLTVIRGAGRNGTHRYRVHMDERAAKPPRPRRPRAAAPANPVDNPQGGDNLTPPAAGPEGGDNLSPGVTELCRSRGDTQVSPERPERPSPPQPPRQAGGAKCTHGRSRCRACGTGSRQTAAADAQAAQAAAAARDTELVAARAAVPWCGDADCSPQDRRLGRVTDVVAKCPRCHPDVVVGPAPRRHLTAVADRPARAWPAPNPPRRAAAPAF